MKKTLKERGAENPYDILVDEIIADRWQPEIEADMGIPMYYKLDKDIFYNGTGYFVTPVS